MLFARHRRCKRKSHGPLSYFSRTVEKIRMRKAAALHHALKICDLRFMSDNHGISRDETIRNKNAKRQNVRSIPP